MDGTHATHTQRRTRMKFGILTHLNALNKLLTLVVLHGLTHAVMASTSLYNSLDDHLAVPMQQQAIMDSYQPRTPSKSTQHYTPIEANYAAQALRSGTRSVNSYGGGNHNQANNHVVATQLPATPHTGTPTAIRDINTWKRTRTTSPTLADEDITLADGMIMKAPGGGGFGDGNSDSGNQPAVTPIGNGTWLLILLAIGYAILRRTKTNIHILNK